MPILGLQSSSQNISSYGVVKYPSVKPIFLVISPKGSLINETVVHNVVHATQDLAEYFDVIYGLVFWDEIGSFENLERLIQFYKKLNAKVATVMLHAWGPPGFPSGIVLRSPDEITYLKRKYDNFVGLIIAEYFTAYYEDSTILSRYKDVLQMARDNGLWVVHSEEWWIWEGQMGINFTALTPIIQQYSDILILVTRTNGATVQYFSWGVNIGYSLAYKMRWGISDQAWYWYEIRDHQAPCEEMPVDIVINMALYALMHGATYLDIEPPGYFFNADGTPKDTFLKFKIALQRYFGHGAPKVKLPQVAILNLPMRFDPEESKTQTGVNVTNRPEGASLFSHYTGRTGNTTAKNIQKALYGFEYDAQGLINTKTLIPVLPWNTSIEILKIFKLVLVEEPFLYDPIYNFTYVTSPIAVYDYLLEASRYVDLFIPQALIFATNVTTYYDSVLGKYVIDYTHMDHSALTGLVPPYVLYGPTKVGTFSVAFTHPKYTRTVIKENVEFSKIFYPKDRKHGVQAIAMVNETYPFLWQYTNEYGRNVYTIFEPTNKKFRDTMRDELGGFLASILFTYFDDISEYGVVLYDIEYNASNYNTPEMVFREPETYIVDIATNVILYAPFTHNNGKWELQLSSNNPYAIPKDIAEFEGFITRATAPILSITYNVTRRTLELAVDASFSRNTSITQVYWPLNASPAVSCKGSELFTYSWDPVMNLLTLAAECSSQVIWTIEAH
jgi:hypothetical protein